MADILSNTCDGTSGTTVSTANSTGPNQWNAAAATGTGTTLTWDNAHAHSGVTSMKTHLATVASTSTIDWTAAISPTPVANAFMRFYCYITANPSVNAVLGKWIGAAASQGTIKITTTGTIQLNNGAGTQLAVTTATVPLNAWCRVEFDCTSNTGTTATLAARLFSGANLETNTPDTGGNLSSAGATVTAQTATARFGVSSSVTQTVAWDLWQDDCAFSDTATPGPSVRIPVLTTPPVPAPPARPPAPQVITAPVTAAGFTVVQAAPTVNASSLTTATVTLGSPTTAGNTLVACVTTFGATTLPAVSGLTLGGAADNWQAAVTDPGSSWAGGAIWYDPACAGGQTAVVVNCTGGSGANGQIYIAVYEVSGALSFDKGSHGDATVGSPVTSWSSGTTGTTAHAAEIFFGAAMGSTSIPAVTGAGTWVTQSTGVGSFDQISGTQIVSATGTAAFSGTMTSGAYIAMVATFFAVTPAAAALAGAGAVTAVVTQTATAALAGAGSLTAASGTTAAPAAAALVTVTQPKAPAALAARPQILPPVQQDFLVVLGDMQPAQHTTAPPTVVAAQIAGLSPQPGFVLIAGDCTNDGDNTGFTGEFTNFDSMYGGIKSILRPVPGNHDWGAAPPAGNLTGYDTYWGSQAHSGATPPHFYSFDTPTGWHIVALDSDEQWIGSLGNPSATFTALAADLAANKGKPLIAYWHHPRFSDGTNTTDPGGTGDTLVVQDIWNLLRDYACDLVFTGHCHSYQRFPKLGKTGSADSAGIREFVVGTGGSGLFTLTAAPGAGARSDVNSWQSGAYDQLNSQWFGYLKLFLTPSAYSWQFVSQNGVGSQNPGAILDSGGPVPTNLSQGAVQPGGLGSAAPAGAGAVTANVTQAVTAALAGAGAVAPVPVTEAVTASLAGAGAVTDVVTQIVTASLAGAGSVTAKAAQAATAAPAGAGALTALVTEQVITSLTGAGALSATSGGFIPGAASLTGAGALTAAGTVFASGTASLTGAGSLTVKAAQGGIASPAAAGSVAALAVLQSPAALTAAGTLTATGTQAGPFTVGALTASTAPGATLTASDAPGGTSGGTLTATDTRTGGPR